MTIFLLGASDPEMEAIEGLLKEKGIPVLYAQKDGRRVHPGNAYQADRPGPGEYILVECAFLQEQYCSMAQACEITYGCAEGCMDTAIGGQADGGPCPYAPDPVVVVRRIDHHRPGDPGYGQGPENFLAASSIGQVFAWLNTPDDVPATPTFAGPGASTALGYVPEQDAEDEEDDPIPAQGAEVRHDRWVLRGQYYTGFGDELAYFEAPVPEDVVMTAAADHCLGHAYRGLCPSVDPDRLMAWRVRTRAANQGRTEAEILADIERARVILRDAPTLLGVRDCYAMGAVHEDALDGAVIDELDPIADLRGLGICPFCGLSPGHQEAATPQESYCDSCGMDGWSPVIPELPEAGTRDGVAYCAILPPTDREPRRKIVLGAASPEQVRAWMLWATGEGIQGIYGDPARGFAGGYLSEK